jgi:hypothetical protein
MHRGESKSPSPIRRRSSGREHRRRSQSPRQDTDRPRRKEGGFRWKVKRQNDEGETGSNGDCRLERGYREHYRARSRSPRRDQDSGDGEQEQTKHKPERPNGERKEKRDKEKKASAVPLSAEPMIIVNVNDRLGTKAAIPCYASDPISKHRRLSSRWASLTASQNSSRPR